MNMNSLLASISRSFLKVGRRKFFPHSYVWKKKLQTRKFFQMEIPNLDLQLWPDRWDLPDGIFPLKEVHNNGRGANHVEGNIFTIGSYEHVN